MLDVVKTPCTVIFTGPTCCGKTQLVLDLIAHEYREHFERIIIICPTIRDNETYLKTGWVWTDDHVFCIEPNDNLFKLIEFFSRIFRGEETLFLIDDIIADESIDKRRQPLLELAISGRHRKHSLWVLTQSYNAIPKNLRRQKKMVFMWYPDDKSDFKLIVDETNVISDNELDSILNQLKKSEHACLYIRLQHPRKYGILS